MIVLMYLIPIFAWLAFIYVQHHFGDRPTTLPWWAVMTGIGMFEYGKGVFGQFHELPVLTMSLAAGVLAAGCVLAVQMHRDWEPLEPEELPADVR